MRLLEKESNIFFLKKVVNIIRNRNQFIKDSYRFSKFYIKLSKSEECVSYQIILLVHKLEKGMCHTNPRPFGFDKVACLLEIIENYSIDKRNDFEYMLACSAVKSWLQFSVEHNWEQKIDKNIIARIKGLPESKIKAGSMIYRNPCIISNEKIEKILLSRRSVRDFTNQQIRKNDLEFAIKAFQTAPTACNRQMCKIYCIKDNSKKEVIIKCLKGIDGFNVNSLTLFLITYDLASLDYLGERYQGLLNVGLTSMNFVNGLHLRGIGSCFLQWSNTDEDAANVRTALSLPESECIGVVIAAGYYKYETIIPCSTKKQIKNVYQEV